MAPTNVKDDKIRTTAEDIASRLEAAGFDVLLDDRDERPGVKFKDADLVGIPFRVTVGKKVTEGTVEVVQRSTREIHDASIAAITDYFGICYGLRAEGFSSSDAMARTEKSWALLNSFWFWPFLAAWCTWAWK